MRTPRLLMAAALAVTCFAPSLALAWNNTGHMTSAVIAYRRLDDADRKAVDAILKQHPYYDNMLVNDLPTGVDAGEWAFARAASWADDVRPPTPAYPTTKPAGATNYHRASWHYKDVPYSPDKSFKMPAETGSTTVSPGAEPGDALTALAKNRDVLADAKASPADRAVALTWVEHLIGDIHQPLHGCTMYSAAYPKGDKGGNDQTVATESGNMNLHTIWDNGLGTANSYAALDALARDLTLDPRCDVSKLAEYAKNKDAEQWLGESHDLAVAFVYLEGKLKTVSTASARSTPTSRPGGELIGTATPGAAPSADVPRLPAMYLVNANMICRQRDALAGARLADAIHAALAK